MTMDKSMRPTIGRILHYVLAPGDCRAANEGQVRPCIVVRVWAGEPNCYNVQVFTDGDNDWEGRGGTLWKASVRYSEDGEPGTIHWPPRV